jgi:triosephosphate isomerase
VGHRAAEPASDNFIRHVCRTLRDALHQRFGQQCRVIYGGSAGPGLLTRLWPDADGIFLLALFPSAAGGSHYSG